MERRVLEKQFSFCHFGHEHPLNHTNSPPKESNSLCSACNLKIITSQGNNIINNKLLDYYYTCKTCPFFLHKVCHNMPKKTLHPSHPNHHLTLKIFSPSTKPLKCEACEDHITNGYYYGCQECGLCYHALCSALPLSISVSCHTHELKLTFSPPYNFSCDICTKPSYNGWLYRCQICEFDTHLTCAISNRKAQPFIVTTTTHSYSSRSISVDYCDEVDEVMRLVTERVNTSSGLKLVQSYDYDSKNPGKQFLHQSVLLTPVSEETSAAASFQFSDTCFSIDLGRSYSGYDPTRRGIGTGNSRGDEDQEGTKGLIGPEVEGKAIARNVGDEANLKPSGFKQQKPLSRTYGSSLNYSFNVGRDERLREAFLVRNDTLKREELGQKGKKAKPAFGNQGKNSSGGWQKLLLCFCSAT